MSYKLRKISFEQTGVRIDGFGNVIPLFEPYPMEIIKLQEEYMNTGIDAKMCVIECLQEYRYPVNKIRVYKALYGTLPQQYVDELRQGFRCSDLEGYNGRIRIEIYE